LKVSSNIYVAGHRGMVGSSILRRLKKEKEVNLITKTHSELDLTNQNAVNRFFEKENIDQIYFAAAKVGGIYANNKYPAEFIYNNIIMEANVIHAAWKNGVKKLLFLGSSCIYPKLANQPMDENSLLSGYLEPTNEPYAISKIAGIKLCESYNRQYGVDFRSVMPSNLYGPGDNYHIKNSHVIPALIRRYHDAKTLKKSEVMIWGTGKPRREFLYVDDLAYACEYIMNLSKDDYDMAISPMESHINIGYGSDVTIADLAEKISKIVGYEGKTKFDNTKPDGSPKKLMNSNKLNLLGWSPNVDLLVGLSKTYNDFKLQNINFSE
jgi:GDP-L-fucose synthase